MTTCFNIPNIPVNFYQHKFAQRVSSDSESLYLGTKKYIESMKVSPSILDLGTGNGILLLMLAKDINHLSLTGIDIQNDLIEIAKKNFMLLSTYLNKKLNYQFITSDYGTIQLNHTYDIIVSNPPFNKKGCGKISSVKEKHISRTETTATLFHLLNSIKIHLKKSGKAFIISPFSRMNELISYAKELNLSVLTKPTESQKEKSTIIFEVSHVTAM